MVLEAILASIFEVLGGLGGVLGSSWGVLGPTDDVLSPTLAPKYYSYNKHQKIIKKYPPKNQGSAAWNALRGTRVKRRIFEKTGPKPRVFALFWKQPQHGPGGRGIWGFPQWHLRCHAGLYICIYIMYGFSMQNVLWHIYYTMRVKLSAEIRHALVGQAERWPRRILLSFAPSAAAAWHCERSRTPARMGIWQSVFS